MHADQRGLKTVGEASSDLQAPLQPAVISEFD
jgi:hypothetical protein